VHWAVPERAIRDLVPTEIGIDLFDGQAYLTLIPFRIEHSRPAGMPRTLAIRMLEINLRTYVRGPDGEAGIYFFSLDASSPLAVAAARLLYGLPYHLAAMSVDRRDRRVTYRSCRRLGLRADLDLEYVTGAERAPASPGTLDHFLVERYRLYVRRGRTLYQTQVRHSPYPLCAVQVNRIHETLLEAAHVPRPGFPAACHFSPGVDVEIFWRERVQLSPLL